MVNQGFPGIRKALPGLLQVVALLRSEVFCFTCMDVVAYHSKPQSFMTYYMEYHSAMLGEVYC